MSQADGASKKPRLNPLEHGITIDLGHDQPVYTAEVLGEDQNSEPTEDAEDNGEDDPAGKPNR
ncbi:MAG TPA: hypothetical protein V6D06_15570 [Trichocoleus sp.]